MSNRANTRVHTPRWVWNAVFYQIFPDRFATSDRVDKPSGLEQWDSPPTRYGYKGGDLHGVIDMLPYLKELGVTALYLNPIFQSAANHRYHTQDYYRVDPLLGGEAAFDALVAAAHEREIRVVLDGVFNHASRGFYQFQQTLENGSSSPYLDWFHFDKSRLAPGVGPRAYPETELGMLPLRNGIAADAVDPAEPRRSVGEEHVPGTADATASEPGNAGALETTRATTASDETALRRCGYEAWWDIPALPKLNTDCSAVREFIFEVAEYWIKRGADGWRLDVPDEIDDDEFWREFRRRVKSVNPEAYIVGEIWTDADRWLQGDTFDAVMNYVFNRMACRFFGAGRISGEFGSPGGVPLVPMDAADLARELPSLLNRYHPAITRAQLNLLSSHDEPRFVSVVSGDAAAFRLATAFQMTLPGTPCVYYGDELGMAGGYDPDCRGAFPADGKPLDEQTFEWTRSLIALRHECVALREGDFRVALAEGQAFGYLRTCESEWILVVFNAGGVPWTGSVYLETALSGPASVVCEDPAVYDTGGRAIEPAVAPAKCASEAVLRFSSGAGTHRSRAHQDGAHHDGAYYNPTDSRELSLDGGVLRNVRMPPQWVKIIRGTFV